MYLLKVSTHVSLRSRRRLTWAETFRHLQIFITSQDDSSSLFIQLSYKTDHIDPCILNKGENATFLLLVKMAEKRFTFQLIFCKIKCVTSSYLLRLHGFLESV